VIFGWRDSTLLLSTGSGSGYRRRRTGLRNLASQFVRVSSKETVMMKVADVALRRPD